MTPERWRAIEPLLDRLLEVREEDRPALAETLSGEDEELRTELLALLAAAKAPGGILDRSAGSYLRGLADEPGLGSAPIGERVGSWRIEREIGRGGMGVVYLAARADGAFEQRAALKLLRRGIDTDEVLERFRRERQILARLEHPHIGRLLDGGATPEGRPYFAMEYVEGDPITAWCDSRSLGIEARLRLFLDVCHAVEYAHRNLVVHRDLKPSNILVTANGSVKLLDFGIAKLLGVGEGEGDMTAPGLRAMTPRYAAPEQIRGEPATTSTDTYALGLVLFDLLVGGSPYRLERHTEAELEKAILQQDVEAPSRAAKSRGEAAVRRGATPERLARRLRGDLDAITLWALHKEPQRRYPTAEALARDVRQHLAGRPIHARPDTLSYRTGKFVGRHRVSVAAAALVMVSVLTGLMGTLWQARLVRHESRKADAVKSFLVSLFRVSDPSQSRGEQVTARELLGRGASRVETELAREPEIQAELLGTLAEVYQRLGMNEQALALSEKTLAITRDVYGPRHLAVATASRTRGMALLAKGEPKNAAPLLRQALDLHRDLLGSKHAEVAEDLDGLAMVARGEGRQDEAESLTREALEMRRGLFGDGKLELTDSLNNLAMVLRERGRLGEAEPLYRDALAIRRRELGDDHPEVALTLDNLSALLRAQGRWEAAEASSREAVALYQKLYGDQNTNTVRGMNNLAAILQSLARYDEAATLYRAVLAFWNRTQEGHPNALISTQNLATVLRDRGDEAEAERLSRSLIEQWPAVVGEKHALNGISRMHLAIQLRDRGDLAEADQLLQEALAVFTGLHGEEHPDVATARHHLGLLALQQGRLDIAESELRLSLLVREKALGAEHPLTAQTRMAIGTVLRERGQVEPALALHRGTLKALSNSFPAGHPDLVAASLEMGRTLLASGQLEEAEQQLRHAAESRRQRFGVGHWRTAEADLRLGECLAARGRTGEARGFAQTSRATLQARRGARDPFARAAAELLRVTSTSQARP